METPEEIISVRNHEAFAAKHMPDLGFHLTEFRVFHWSLQDWRNLGRKLTSPVFNCGGHRWRILLFPIGNTNRPEDSPFVSIYLDCVDDTKEGWHACVQFALVISNPHDPTIYTVSHAHHRFTPAECDWGFTRFSELRELLHPQPNINRPTIEEDTAVASVYVRVLEDPTGVLWHSFVGYDSKKHTGYVGLKNLGATSYMNSLLQSLFCTNYFRKAIYQIPTEDENPTESVSLALQRVFYRLQTSDKAIGLSELVKSFGWTSLDSFLSQDIQEFNRVLQDKLESEMKGSQCEDAIAKLFSGKMKTSIKCDNIDYESSRIEEFHDIQLNVSGITTLYDSFRDYVAVETFGGENKYRAEGFGLQDARKRTTFLSLPPVLHLHLKRYKYQMERDAMVKINDRFEYPFEIDLGEFLDETADRSKPWRYKLHGVIVHFGDIHSGHNISLIKPDRDTRWLKFDDDRVTPVTDREVLEENYGGVPLNAVIPRTQANPGKLMKRSMNAYLLVYVRESAIDEILAPLTEADTPPHLKRMFEQEHTEIEAKKKEREEQNLSVTVGVVTDRTFAAHEGFDLANFDERFGPLSDLPIFHVPKQEVYSVFKSRVAEHFRYPESQVRLWVLINRQNKTVRAETYIPETDPSLTVEQIRNNMAARQQSMLRLYLDFLPGPSMRVLLDTPGTIVVFLKYFDATRQSLRGVGKIYVQRSGKVSSLIPIINKRMGQAPNTPLRLCEEIKPGMIEAMHLNYALSESEIQDGDIICFQDVLSDVETQNLETQGLYSTPRQFYDFLENRVMVLFRPKFNDPEVYQPEFSLMLSKKHNYDTIASEVGELIRHDPTKLRFTTTQPANGTPKSIVRRSSNQTVNEIISPSYFSSFRNIVLYERLHVSILKLETDRTLKVIWTGTNSREESMHMFLASKTSTVNDLTEHLMKRVQLSPTGSGRIRVFEVAGRRVRKELAGYCVIGDIVGSNPVELFAEEISREEVEAEDHHQIINVFHFAGDATRTHGVPFKLVVKPGERMAETMKRLQHHLEVPDKDFSRFKFALVQENSPQNPSAYFEDDDIMNDHKFAPGDFLGLNHADKSESARVRERGIKFGVSRDVPEPIELFVEEIPREHKRGNEQDDVTNAFHLTRDVARTYGIRFKFEVPHGLKGALEERNTALGGWNV